MEDHQLLVCWTRACSILHNLLLEDGYEYGDFEHDPDMVQNPNEDNFETPTTNDPLDKAHREVVKVEVLQFHRDIDG